jgi:hypothetical protein
LNLRCIRTDVIKHYLDTRHLELGFMGHSDNGLVLVFVNADKTNWISIIQPRTYVEKHMACLLDEGDMSKSPVVYQNTRNTDDNWL